MGTHGGTAPTGTYLSGQPGELKTRAESDSLKGYKRVDTTTLPIAE
jgi:hypothetical protein